MALIHAGYSGSDRVSMSAFYDELSLNLTESELTEAHQWLYLWERYEYLYYAIVGLLCLSLFMYSYKLYKKYRREYLEAPFERWQLKKAYLKWITNGFEGCHRFYLQSPWGFLFPALFSFLLISLSYDLRWCVYPTFLWNYVHFSIYTDLALRLFIGFWLLDLYWIKYRCYQQPYLWLREAEDNYLEQSRRSIAFSNAISAQCRELIESERHILNDLYEIRRREYSDEADGLFSKMVRFFSFSSEKIIKFEKGRAEDIKIKCREANEVRTRFLDFSEEVIAIFHSQLIHAEKNRYIAIGLLEALDNIRQNEAKEVNGAESGESVESHEVIDTADIYGDILNDLSLIDKDRDMVLRTEWMDSIGNCDAGDALFPGKAEAKRMHDAVQAEADRAVLEVEQLLEYMEHKSKLLMICEERIKVISEIDIEFHSNVFDPLREEIFYCKPTVLNCVRNKKCDMGLLISLYNSKEAGEIKFKPSMSRVTKKMIDLEHRLHALLQAGIQ